ncbi:hypothetical protein [Spirosoma montaniterrae]|uniref:Secretion system C-terminal sorting domain-containing protein n=1 Tax=Spirosoma montaniterrae TaxID=1178516 RepID=A0A1P9WY35_9BACT|nr:hypothetical protein [Spirosoma montaniterrae]AQG80274.1 hypothetical protein AWR27_13680 [Spirosoma montaniterrae]
MKAIKFSLLLLFLASPIFIFSNFRPAAGKLNTAVYAESSLARVRVAVDKPSGMPISIRVMDQDGWPLHEQILTGDSKQANIGINLCALPDGLYRMEMAGGRTMQAYEIKLSSINNTPSGRQVNVRPTDG